MALTLKNGVAHADYVFHCLRRTSVVLGGISLKDELRGEG
jgi:hypothetical protein